MEFTLQPHDWIQQGKLIPTAEFKFNLEIDFEILSNSYLEEFLKIALNTEQFEVCQEIKNILDSRKSS